jgi:hypothetical protein
MDRSIARDAADGRHFVLTVDARDSVDDHRPRTFHASITVRCRQPRIIARDGISWTVERTRAAEGLNLV